MNLPHRAPIGALRTQAGVKRSETPVKRSRQQTEYRRYDRISGAPIGASICSYILRRGFATLHHLPVFCPPLSGLAICSYILCRGFASLHHLPVFCRPYRGFNMLMHPLQGFRFAPPPACVLSPPVGASICSYILRRGFAPLHHLPVILTPLSGFAITIRINMMPISMLFPYELRIMNYELSIILTKNGWFFLAK